MNLKYLLTIWINVWAFIDRRHVWQYLSVLILMEKVFIGLINFLVGSQVLIDIVVSWISLLDITHSEIFILNVSGSVRVFILYESGVS